MLSPTIAQLKADITQKMKGTSLSQIKDFYTICQAAAGRMISRIDIEETRRTMTLASPFWDNVNDYVLPTDFKSAIDLRPTQKDRGTGDSHFADTTARQFNERLASNSMSIRWNSGVRTLRAQIPRTTTTVVIDDFSSPSSNGLWIAGADMAAAWDEAINWDQGSQETWDNGLFTEQLNFIQGNSSVGFNLSGSTGVGNMTNSTASVLDLSAYNYEDASMLYFFIPIGYASRFTSFTLARGSDSGDYVTVTVTTKADGTAFTDGWNFLVFQWNIGTAVGSPDNTNNTWRFFQVNYTAGSFIKGCYLDSWTDSLGEVYEIEYYSGCTFRTSAGAWEYAPTSDTDLINVDVAAYEILKTEMMIDITQIIRQGAIRVAELTDWRLMLNGQPQSRYVKDPPYHGLYFDYSSKFPSSAIPVVTRTYDFDV